MSVEILPTSSDGVETETTKSWTPDAGETLVTRKQGDTSSVDALYEAAKISVSPTTKITGLSVVSSRGRGTMTQNEVNVSGSFQSVYSLNDSDGLQELLAIDVIRPLYAAPYFKTLTYDEIASVTVSIASRATTVTGSWNALQKTLFKHLVMGRTTYYETAYVFRRSFRTPAGKVLNKAVNDQNTVVTLPSLSKSMGDLIATLPTGEWLKRPTQVRYLGKDGWDVSEEYLWSPQWSIVYGGTFTGVV